MIHQRINGVELTRVHLIGISVVMGPSVALDYLLALTLPVLN